MKLKEINETNIKISQQNEETILQLESDKKRYKEKIQINNHKASEQYEKYLEEKKAADEYKQGILSQISGQELMINTHMKMSESWQKKFIKEEEQAREIRNELFTARNDVIKLT